MCIRQYWSVWLISSVALLLVDLRSVALLQKDTTPRRCYKCGPSTNVSSKDCTSELCPAERPYCGTVATAPNLTSSLVCAEVTEELCSLTYTELKQTYHIICVCATDLCNSPFKPDFYQELQNFTSTRPAAKSNLTNYAELFLNSTKYVNITETSLYDELTVDKNVVTTTNLKPTNKGVEIHHLPKAEELKQEAPVPSDDDDDESEGSGAFEESRTQKRPASPPAAPSSFLPEKKAAASLCFNVFVTVPIFLYHVII